MKQGIHPDYQIADVHCSCGNTFQTRSTVSEIRADICSNCHPFYTGKQKLVDTGGRVERFQRRYAKTQAGAAGRQGLSRPREPTRQRPRSADHLYGGQAVVEGVMMRGADHWAVAVRKPAGEVHVESHEIDSIAERHPILAQARSCAASSCWVSRSRSASRALHDRGQPVLGRRGAAHARGRSGSPLAVAMIFFVGDLHPGSDRAVRLGRGPRRRRRAGVWSLEGVFRVGLFVGYLWVIGRTKDIHRVFEYHGAEHKTIAAFEHGDPLDDPEPDRPVLRRSTFGAARTS